MKMKKRHITWEGDEELRAKKEIVKKKEYL